MSKSNEMLISFFTSNQNTLEVVILVMSKITTIPIDIIFDIISTLLYIIL
jgi:hypothetical protein